MVDVRPPVAVSPLSPERVARAEFGNSFRGFDPSQVRAFLARVADELRALRERERALIAQVADLEQRVAEAAMASNRALDEPIDEHRLAELLGAETARVIEAARGAAAVLRANAEEQAGATVAAAEADAVHFRAQAEALLDERAEAAEAEAARLLADAEADAARLRQEADAVREEARRDAEEHRAEARDDGRRMVAEARAVRERILSDMARRRNLARQQLERLRAGRERLLDAIETVRRAVEGASGELNDAVVEAKVAGERAARQIDVAVVPPMRELDAEVELAKDAGLVDLEAIEREVVGAAGFDEAVAAVEGDAPEPVDEVDEVDEVDGGPPSAGDPAGPEDTEGSAAEPGVTDERSHGEVAAGDADSELPAGAPAVDEVDATEDAAQRIDVESAQTVSDEGPDPHEPGPSAESEQPMAGKTPARRRGFSHAVDDVFTRWKQGDGDHPEPPPGDAATAEATASEAAPTGEDAPSDGAQDTGPDAEDAVAVAEVEDRAAGSEAGEDQPEPAAAIARQTRDAVLAGIARDLTRHLKLALSDEQNLVLEHLRDDRSRQSKRAVADLLADLELSDRFEQATRRELIGALEAGWGAVRAGRDEGPEPHLLDSAVGEICGLLIGPLRDRLRTALEDVTDGPSGAERVRNLYRETRTEQTGPAAEHGALLAFALGQYAAAGRLAGGAEVRVRWAFDDCVPDCYDNFLSGAVPLESSFPTDHRHPPAFPGCRCLLIVETGTADEVPSGGPRGHLPPTAV